MIYLKSCYSPCDNVGNWMNHFIKVIKRDPQVKTKTKGVLDMCINLPPNYQSSKIGYDSLIQNVIVEEMLSLMSATIEDIDIESKMKIGKGNNSESRLWS